ncbi:FAD-binding oxidoreductase [Kribbella sp. NPDC051587]|uniref:FAD-binding oxidoreductase n=1 Tax=Kribbella sp. NPDC051587 TaxID=3364119 RepID=UPI0037ABC659
MTFDELRREFGGEIVEAGSAEYDAVSRTVFGTGRPAGVVRPRSVADVQAVVQFAVDTGLALAVRGGGHAFARFGTNDDGVVLDLSGLDDVLVLDERLVRIGGGATWGQVADALAPYGLAISSGDTRSVGVGGLTLSGGIGWKVRKYGLALDQLVAAEVVTADGDVVRASADEHPELFWGLRGGGGNFGVVTAFEFMAHPTTEVLHGKIAFPATEAASVLQGWADYARTAPDELTSIATFANPFLGGPDAPIEIHLTWDGDDASALDPIRALGTVIADDVALTPYAETLVVGQAPPPGIEFVARSAFVDKESVSEVLRILAETGATAGSPIIAVRSVGGAVARVAADATAYPYRQAELMFVTTNIGPAPAIAAARPALDALWERLAPHSTGAYANFLSTTEVDAVYPAQTYEKLAALKRQYDPGNLFRGNHNIDPDYDRPGDTGR